jgi:hypothetical protein
MTALGQTRKSIAATAGSVFPSGTDIISQAGHVGFGPFPDMANHAFAKDRSSP